MACDLREVELFKDEGGELITSLMLEDKPRPPVELERIEYAANKTENHAALWGCTPFLIDHVALVPLGVWDKGGKPSGVEVTTPTEEEQLAGMVREVIDAACKPALEKLEEISGRLDQLEKTE